ncbi:MAG: nucleotidyl transferase AbiEii/AbiGii toxin family protein [Planctomycetes bacterium]|nr:nucleotidyl transferase AbiEii/AbiGii toxin family protein [Planctomycetota bacterium]MCB9918983.1 nucleotidyl transferase AbiEii/AbiGii toxin family protein [Planctomycetota bacterium]
MFPIDVFQSTLVKATRILQDLAIPFHLTGGITSVTYGEPRLTQDVDIVLDPEATRAHRSDLLERLRAVGFLVDEPAARTSIEEGRLFQALDVAEGLKLDFYPRQLVAGELSRSREYELFAGVTLPIVSLPDAIVSKLVWIQRGSHKSRRDVRSMWARTTATDRAKTSELASSLELDALLSRVLSEPDELD